MLKENPNTNDLYVENYNVDLSTLSFLESKLLLIEMMLAMSDRKLAEAEAKIVDYHKENGTYSLSTFATLLQSSKTFMDATYTILILSDDEKGREKLKECHTELYPIYKMYHTFFSPA